MSDNFFSWKNGTLQLRVYIQPKASGDEIVGLHGDYLKVRITAPPIEGKANAHLLKYLAEVFGLGRHQIEITAGKKKVDTNNYAFRSHLVFPMEFAKNQQAFSLANGIV